jgi:nitrite reductase/ring-hydroxylating ferredoxin subunit/DMSO/TMAO reductase YedYZ heme-binding membrane subunit
VSVTYKAIGWNRQKRLYDVVLGTGIGLYLLAFVGGSLIMRPGITIETLLIRAFGTAALALLHLVLSIGPLARLDRRFLPLLYNRRHLGVATFLLGLAHGGFSLVQFHALGDVNPLVSVLTSYSRIDSLSQFPFQPLGLVALLVLLLMAATSHDFWLAQLTAPTWKRLHMAAYLAYGLLVAHVALGALQSELHPGYGVLLTAGVVWLVGLHLVAGWRERRGDRKDGTAGDDGWVKACRIDDIVPERAKITCLAGERIAIFRHDGKISALSNACQHQNGPLGEGRVISGCVVCPWHGYEYDPATGASPPPFGERVPTFNIRVADNEVWVDPRPNQPGTRVEPVVLDDGSGLPPDSEFYVGYRPHAPPRVAGYLRRVVVALLVAAPLTAVTLAALQVSFADSRFEYGKVREFEGRLSADPYPSLAATQPATMAGRTLLLVDVGKKGADGRIAGLDGRHLRLSGQLIYRNATAMIELTPSAIEDLGASRVADPATRSLGETILLGEIVDSKCHLGVMKPGEGKSHRGCAVRCISGGAPPMLWVRDHDGAEARYLLAGRDGRPLGEEILHLVAEPVEDAGELIRHDGLWILRTEPSEITRIDADG